MNQETLVEPAAPAAPDFTQVPIYQRPQQLLELPVSAILLDNYRTSMDKAELRSLADNIKEVGLMQPVPVYPLAEPHDGFTHGMTAGHRRLAAHRLAGLTTIPALSRQLTEAEAALLRLVENVQRANPHPADEAQAIAGLMRQGYSRSEVADKMGKTPRWVAQREAVAGLLGGWLKALRDDRLTLGAAQEIARWPHPAQQRLLDSHPAGTLSLDTAKYLLAKEQQQLSAAPWKLDDADLVPKAGACLSCPKRSSCATDLFAETGKKDQCLDKECWAGKFAAHIDRMVAEHSTSEEPVLLVSANYHYNAPNGRPAAITSGRYEVVRKKREGRPAVLVDGPHAGHLRYIKLTGPLMTASAGGQSQLSRGEQMRETRRKRLTSQAERLILAGRIMAQAEATDPAQARPMVAGLLVELIAEQLVPRGKSKVNELTLQQLQAKWGWPAQPQFRYGEAAKWVREQVHACCPQNDTQRMVFLLLFVLANHELDVEYSRHQHQLAERLQLPGLLDGLGAAAEAQVKAAYHPRTLRPLKAAA